MALSFNQLLTDKLEPVKIMGVSLAVIAGAAITISIIVANRTANKYYKAATLKLKEEGYDPDTWLDKAFASIEESAGFSPKQQASKKLSTGTGATPPVSADGGIVALVGVDGLQSWADPDILRYEDVFGNKD